jgi:hypothetical protein
LLDNGMPAIVFIITGLPTTGRPIGQRGAKPGLFFEAAWYWSGYAGRDQDVRQQLDCSMSLSARAMNETVV